MDSVLKSIFSIIFIFTSGGCNWEGVFLSGSYYNFNSFAFFFVSKRVLIFKGFVLGEDFPNGLS